MKSSGGIEFWGAGVLIWCWWFVFAALSRLADQLRDAGIAIDTLSMGMSADLEDAIAEGATIVRVGSAIFGARQYAHAPA